MSLISVCHSFVQQIIRVHPDTCLAVLNDEDMGVHAFQPVLQWLIPVSG